MGEKGACTRMRQSVSRRKTTFLLSNLSEKKLSRTVRNRRDVISQFSKFTVN